jgi:tetratricopeptide (TPR) repeat protein
MPTFSGVAERRSGRRALLLTTGPIVGVAVGAITNIITSHWNWWLFTALTVLVALTALLAVALDEGAVSRRRERVAAVSRPVQRSTVANTLPRDVDDFIGREAEIALLLNAANGNDREHDSPIVCSIEGIGGVGKTSLAIHMGYSIAGRYPDAVLFIDLRAHTEGQPPLSTGDALGVLLADFGVPGEDIPDSLDGRISVWRRRLLDARVLVILDNASGVNQVENLLAGNHGCMFIITSRQRLIELPGVLSVQLDSLPSADAAALFQRVLGSASMERDESDAAQIVGRIGGLPLAIRLTAARLRSHPAWTVRDLLKQDITRQPDLERVYALSYRDLDPELRIFFRMLSVHPGAEITPEAAAVLTGATAQVATTSLEELYDRYLLTEPKAGRFKFHDLIKVFASHGGADMSEESAREEALLRLLGYYAFMAESASQKIGMADLFTLPAPAGGETPALTDRMVAAEWLDEEFGNLLSCASYAADRGLMPFAWQIPASLAYYLRIRGFLGQAVSLLEDALHSLQGGIDPRGEAIIRRRRGQLARLQGDVILGRSYVERSMELTIELGDRQGTAWCHHELGHLHWIADDLADAERHFIEAAAINRELGNVAGVAGADLNLGPVVYAAGDPKRGWEYLRDALQIYRELRSDRGIAAVMYQMGAFDRDSGDYSSAREKITSALDMYNETGNRQGQAECLLNLAVIDRLVGDYGQAKERLSEALAICVELGFRRREADTYAEMAALAEAMGDDAMSLLHRQHSERIYGTLRQDRT